MKHPLAWIPTAQRRGLFFVFLALTLAILFLFQPLNLPLMTATAPQGIISLQVAGSASKAQAMLTSWGTEARLFAAFSLGFDYLFMPAYALTLALASLLAAGRHPDGFARLGSWAALAALLASLLDALENLGQFQELFHGRVDLAPAIAICAIIKFSFILLALIYGLAGWIWRKSPATG